MKAWDYINLKIEVMERAGVDVQLLDRVKVPYDDTGDMKVNGYFCDVPLEFRLAINKPFSQWFPLFIHEYAHYTQWKSDAAVWRVRIFKDDPMNVLDHWMKGKIKLSPKMLERCVRLARDCELDCERRAVSQIKRYDLPISVKTYTQRANAYLYFYNAIGVFKQWYRHGYEPYSIKGVWSRMPITFNNNYDEMSLEWYLLYKEHCL